MNSNPIVTGSFAVITGDVMGLLVNRLMETVGDRMKLSTVLTTLGPDMGNALDAALNIFLHVGITSIGCEIVSRAMPWIFEEPAGYSLFLITFMINSPRLTENIQQFNKFLTARRIDEGATPESETIDPEPR